MRKRKSSIAEGGSAGEKVSHEEEDGARRNASQSLLQKDKIRGAKTAKRFRELSFRYQGRIRNFCRRHRSWSEISSVKTRSEANKSFSDADDEDSEAELDTSK